MRRKRSRCSVCGRRLDVDRPWCVDHSPYATRVSEGVEAIRAEWRQARKSGASAKSQFARDLLSELLLGPNTAEGLGRSLIGTALEAEERLATVSAYLHALVLEGAVRIVREGRATAFRLVQANLFERAAC